MNLDGKILSVAESSYYANAGMVKVSGFKHANKQKFESYREPDLDLGLYETERRRIGIKIASEPLPRTVFWRNGIEFIAKNKQSLKKRL